MLITDSRVERGGEQEAGIDRSVCRLCGHAIVTTAHNKEANINFFMAVRISDVIIGIVGIFRMSESKPSACRMSSYSIVSVMTRPLIWFSNLQTQDLLVRGRRLGWHGVAVALLELSDMVPGRIREASSMVCELVALVSFLSVSFTLDSSISYAIFVLFCRE